MNVAIIPARGGSKRIANKNSKFFFGNPIIFYPLNTLIKSKLFTKIFVTSDDEKIIKYVNKKFPKIITIKREKKYSTDKVKTITVIKNFIKKNIKDMKIKKICCVYPATPLINKKNLKKGLRVCNKYGRFVIPVIKSKSKNGNFIELKKNSIKKLHLKNNKSTYLYKDSGQFYWGTLNNWIKGKSIIDKSSKCFILKDYEAIDINFIEDWNKAKMLFKII